MPNADFNAYLASLAARHPWMPAPLLRRYARTYGTRAERILQGARDVAGLGEEVLPGLYAREIDYLRREEWAVTAEDILYRRSKLALHVPADGPEVLDRWLHHHPQPGAWGEPL
jgi:glycerol-3-phosphate dehydrogenase